MTAGNYVHLDFELIVRIADKLGADIKQLVPFGSEGDRADMGQSRGAQSGEADRNAIWLSSKDIEPKMSPSPPRPPRSTSSKRKPPLKPEPPSPR